MADATNTSRHYVAPWIAASLADLVGLGLLVGVQEPWTLAAAGGLSRGGLAADRVPPPAQRQRKVAGAFIRVRDAHLRRADGGAGARARGRRRQSDLRPCARAAARERAVAGDFGRLAAALPSCEALSAGTVEERRAIIATLVRRADADAVALLRWALGASDPDLAVDAALALEELTASFDARLAACRDALAAARSADVGGAGDGAAVPVDRASRSGRDDRRAGGERGRAGRRRAHHPRHRRRRRGSGAGAGPRQRGARGLRARRRGQGPVGHGRHRAHAAGAGRAAPGHGARLHRRRAADRRRRRAPAS